jgi:hypothetical protein
MSQHDEGDSRDWHTLRPLLVMLASSAAAIVWAVWGWA